MEALGLKSDAPRKVVKAIVTAVEAVGPSDPAAVLLALSTFNLDLLLKLNANVATFASGISSLANSGRWTQIVDECK